MKRMCVLACLAACAVASGCSAASTARSAAPGTGVASGSSPASPLAASPPPCTALGLRIDALPVGTRVEHTEQDALRAAASANVGPTSQVRVDVSWVQDPTADKVGLGDNTQFHVMWVLDGTDTTPVPSLGELVAPASSAGAARPGTLYRTITLIDDKSMKLGGNFNCTSTNTGSSPDSAPPEAHSAASSPSPTCSAFAISLGSDRHGQSLPVEAAIWFAKHGSVQDIPTDGWRELHQSNNEATVQSGGVQLHTLEGPDQTWQVDSGQYYCP